jgi:hypothetical protein
VVYTGDKDKKNSNSDRDLTTFEPFQEARLLLWEVFEFKKHLKQNEKDFLNDIVAKLGVYHSLTEKQKNAVCGILHSAKCRKQVSDSKKKRRRQ